MKIKNFKITNKLVEHIGDSALNMGTIYATIDVTTGWFHWKKTVTREIYAAYYEGTVSIWRFLDNGDFLPRYVNLELHSNKYEIT